MWIFWIVLLVVIVWVVKATMGDNTTNKNLSDESPIDILKKRYANGEINEEEYERRLKELGSK